MCKILVFDWDGTIHNTKKLYGNAFREAYAYLVKNGYAPPRLYSDDDVSIYLGMNATQMWNSFMPELDTDIKAKASNIIGEEMVEQIKRHNATLYENAIDVLAKLKSDGHILVFLSNCKRAYMEAHRTEFQLDRFFDSYFCCEDYGYIPKEDIFPDILKKYGTNSDIIVIGDRYHDIAVAKKYNLYSVGCGYGFGTIEELSDTDVIINDITKILKLEILKNTI